MPSAGRSWLLLSGIGVVVPVLGLVELGAHRWFATRAPTIEEWRALRADVAALRIADDLVVVAPDWAEPLARHALGDALMPLEQVARADATPFARAIEISALGARAAELTEWSVTATLVRGKFRLRRLENPTPASVRLDLTAALGPERVTVADGSGGATCAWQPAAPPLTGGLHGPVATPAARFVCAGAAGGFVGVTVIEDERYRPHRCVWAALPDGESLHIRYRDVPLGDELRGYTGDSWFLTRDGGAAPVFVAVRVAGELVGTLEHRDGAGWTPFTLALGPHAGRPADVEFTLTTPRREARHLCFHVDTR